MDNTVLMSNEMVISNKFMKNTWIGDTGATSHMVNSDKGMIDVKIINERIKMGNRKHMTATKQGLLPCIIKQADGKDKECKIEVKYIPKYIVICF